MDVAAACHLLQHGWAGQRMTCQHPPAASRRPSSEAATCAGLQVVELSAARRSRADVQATTLLALTPHICRLPSKLHSQVGAAG